MLDTEMWPVSRDDGLRPGRPRCDPLLELTAATEAAALQDMPTLELLAKVRLKAIRRLRRDGWSYDQIAAATGLSKGRVAQLSKDPRGGS